MSGKMLHRSAIRPHTPPTWRFPGTVQTIFHRTPRRLPLPPGGGVVPLGGMGDAVGGIAWVSGGQAWRFRQATIGGAGFVVVAFLARCLQVVGVVREVWPPCGWLLLVDDGGVAGADVFVADLAGVAGALENVRPQLIFPFAAARRLA